MATKKKKQKSEHELFESSEAIADRLSKSEQWIEDHKVWVYSFLGIIALVVGGFLLYRNYMASQNNLAQSEMFQAQYWFETDSLNLALNGDGNNYGFLDIVENYGSTKAGNLANFYTGVCYMKQGDYNLAIDYLSDFSADDKLVQARAYALIGDAYMEQSDYDQAVSFYDKAASHYPNQYFTPNYLMKQALAYEKLSELQNAIGAYDKIIKDFPQSTATPNARKHKSRVEGMASK